MSVTVHDQHVHVLMFLNVSAFYMSYLKEVRVGGGGTLFGGWIKNECNLM